MPIFMLAPTRYTHKYNLIALTVALIIVLMMNYFK